jgi:hypothetical protein
MLVGAEVMQPVELILRHENLYGCFPLGSHYFPEWIIEPSVSISALAVGGNGKEDQQHVA